MARLAMLLLLPVLFESVYTISFYLPVNSRKCLREEIHKDVLVTGDYEMSGESNIKTNLKVSSDLLLAAGLDVWGLARFRFVSISVDRPLVLQIKLITCI